MKGKQVEAGFARENVKFCIEKQKNKLEMLTHWNQFCFFGQVAPTNPIAGRREWMGETWWGALKLIQTKFMAIRTWKRRKELRPIPELLHVEMGKLEVICHCECFG